MRQRPEGLSKHALSQFGGMLPVSAVQSSVMRDFILILFRVLCVKKQRNEGRDLLSENSIFQLLRANLGEILADG